MLKLTKTGIGLLTKQYRSVLRKCLAINVGIFALGLATIVMAPKIVEAGCSDLTSSSSTADIVACLTSGATEIGWNASTSGSWSNALGYAARGGNSFALALGTEAHADAYGSVALGPYATTSGNYAFAQGWGSLASKQGSIAIGSGSFASAENAVALGTYSVVTTSNTISVGHLSTDLNKEGDVYGSNSFRRIVNVAEGSGAHDAITVSQLGNIASGTKILNANGESAITFGTESGQTTVGTAISNVANQLYNYYYTFRVDEKVEVIDSTSFFQKHFSTPQKVDLHIKNPTHLRAFTKCDEVCPRPSERFSLSLSQEQMFKNNASVDAGTSRHCLRQFGDVVADLLKNTAAKSLRISEFMNEEVCHA